MNISICIGCGCDDNHACDEGCYWLRVDLRENKGVCSACEAHVEAWDRGDRTPHAQPIAEIEAEMAGEIRHPRPEIPGQPKPAACCHPSPLICKGDHDWPFEDVRDADACRRCGMSFLRYTFTECI